MGNIFSKLTRTPTAESKKSSRFSKLEIRIIGCTILGLAIAIPLITCGSWYLGPIIKYPKYAHIDYVLENVHSGSKFFEGFSFSGEPSADNGFAQYTSREIARANNLTYITSKAAFLGVDAITTIKLPKHSVYGKARNSLSISSKTNYSAPPALFILSITHVPTGCGVWPQLSLHDPTRFPDHGEITIMDAVNNGTWGATMGLFVHAHKCTMELPPVWRKGTAKLEGPQATCSHRLHGQKGCRYVGSEEGFGPAFNQLGGGVVAVEWRSQGIRMWRWRKEEVPMDVRANQPLPDKWAKPVADWPGTNCELTEPSLGDLRIMINTNFCGLRPEHEWEQSGCPSRKGSSKNFETCRRFVAANPMAMRDAYWGFEYIKVFQEAAVVEEKTRQEAAKGAKTGVW